MYNCFSVNNNIIEINLVNNDIFEFWSYHEELMSVDLRFPSGFDSISAHSSKRGGEASYYKCNVYDFDDTIYVKSYW